MSDRNKSHSAAGEHTAEELIQNIQKLMAEVEERVKVVLGVRGDADIDGDAAETGADNS